jgi:hypothetical protein
MKSMPRTVDLVVTGDDTDALGAAFDATQRGLRVLLVLCSGDRKAVQSCRRNLRQPANCHGGQLTVVANAEVVCVDGVDGVEAVVIRRSPTGRLYAVNASAFLSCDSSACPMPVGGRP